MNMVNKNIVEDDSLRACRQLLKNPKGKFSGLWKMQSEGFIKAFE